MKLDGDLLLLTESKRCPQCGKWAVDWPNRKCSNCGLRTMKSEDSFNRLTDEGLRSFYVFFPKGKFVGWAHSDHLLNVEKPNRLSDKPMEAPDESYGKRALPKGCSAE